MSGNTAGSTSIASEMPDIEPGAGSSDAILVFCTAICDAQQLFCSIFSSEQPLLPPSPGKSKANSNGQVIRATSSAVLHLPGLPLRWKRLCEDKLSTNVDVLSSHSAVRSSTSS